MSGYKTPRDQTVTPSGPPSTPTEVEGVDTSGDPATAKPVIVGVVVGDAIPTSHAVGDAVEWLGDDTGHGAVVQKASATPLADGISNTSVVPINRTNVIQYTPNYPFLYDPTGNAWNRARGNTVGGAFVQGADADDVVATAINPLPTGGIFRSTLPNYTDLDRVQTHYDSRGNLRSLAVGLTGAGADSLSNNLAWMAESTGSGSSRPLVVANFGFNPVTALWDRVRCDSNGTYVQGNVANDEVDAGNPVGIGGIGLNTSPAGVTEGDRVKLRLTTRGESFIALSQTTSSDGSGNVAGGSFYLGSIGTPLGSAHVRSSLFNATTWDRIRSFGGAANTTGIGTVGSLEPLLSTNDMSRLTVTNAAAAGNTTLLAAVAAQSHRGHGLLLSAAGATIVSLTDGAGGAVIFGPINLAANTPIFIPLSGRPYFKGTNNTALVLTSSAAVQVDGQLYYITAA